MLISASTYTVLINPCPYRYALKLRQAPAIREFRPMFPGKVTHGTVVEWFRHGLKDSHHPHKLLPVIFEKYFSAYHLKLLPGETKESLFGDCAQWLGNYLDMLKEEDLLRMDTVVEQWYGSARNPLPMTRRWEFAGASDFVKEDPDGDEIYDGKCTVSGRSNYMQLLLYASARERMLNRPVKMVHFLYFKDKTKGSFPFNEQIKAKVIKRMDQVCRNIQEGNLPARPSEQNCRFCPYRKSCQYSKVRD